MPPPWKKKNPSRVSMSLRSESELTGLVARIVFASEDGHFQVARFQIEGEPEPVSIAGNLPGVAAGEPLRVTGKWRMHPQHGATFEVDSYVPILPADAEMMGAYLGSGLVKGIGPSYANRIVDHFGEETLDILEHAPERLLEVKGLGRKRAEAISAAWIEHRNTHEVMMFLAHHGLSPALARRLFRHYGGEAAAVLKTNPYRAGIEVHGIGFHTADRLAENVGIAKDSPDRIRAAFQHLLVNASNEGHTYLPRETLLDQSVELLAVPAPQVEAVFAEEADRARTLRVQSLRDGTAAVFMRSMYQAESGVARLVSTLINEAKPVVKGHVEARLAAFEKRFRFQLAPQQREAIHSVLEGGVGVITGGPGTGKTTLVRALLHCLHEDSVPLALCSPTGRAAQRLSETTHHPAMTIHRLLKFNAQTHRFGFAADNPLEADLIIVDEASMLDIPLAYYLLSAVKPGATIVFVGDVDQLPSVGAGNFLHDLIESGRPRTTRLNVIFRQASQSQIIVNSHRVNEGKMPVRHEKGTETDFFFIDRDDPMAIREAVLEMASQRIPRKFGLDPIRDVQVLSPMRRGDLGTIELNKLLQATLNGASDVRQIGPLALRLGDKVIQNQNNYDLDVFNGDVGTVTSISVQSMTLRVQFGKRSVEYRWDDADQLALAYAVTIHKSQGSEYPAVIVIMHTQHFIMLRRNLLYTGITRGKKLVVVVGSKRALGMAVRQSGGNERMSALDEWLTHPPDAQEELF